LGLGTSDYVLASGHHFLGDKWGSDGSGNGFLGYKWRSDGSGNDFLGYKWRSDGSGNDFLDGRSRGDDGCGSNHRLRLNVLHFVLRF
jgi:hypothetical protein